MQDRTRMAKDEQGSIRQLWHVLQMVQFFTHTSIDVQRVKEPDLDSTVVTTVYVCGQSIIQRTHAKQCRCLLEGSMLPSWNVK